MSDANSYWTHYKRGSNITTIGYSNTIFRMKKYFFKKTSSAVKTYMTFTNVYWFRVIFELIVTLFVWRFWRTVDFGFKDAKESSNGSPVGGRSKFSKPDHNIGQRSSEMSRSICVH